MCQALRWLFYMHHPIQYPQPPHEVGVLTIGQRGNEAWGGVEINPPNHLANKLQSVRGEAGTHVYPITKTGL